MTDEHGSAPLHDAAVTASLLAAVRSDLDRVVRPAVSDANACATVQMITEILEYLIIRHRDGSAVDGGRDVWRRALDSSKAEADDTGDVVSLRARRNALWRNVEDLIRRAAFSGAQLAQAVGTDLSLFEEEARLRTAEVMREEKERAGVEVEVTAERLGALVNAHRPDGSARVCSFCRVYGGYSKDTFLFDLEGGDGAIEPLVLRRDLPFGPAGTTVRDEFALLRRLFECGFPVAEPLLVDPDGCHVGQPAMVSRRVAGRAGTAGWSADPAAREAIVRELARVVARLHAVPPAEVGLEAANGNAREALRAYIERWRDRWQRFSVHPAPTVAAGFDWLLANVPGVVGRPAIVHGDIGFHNVMVEGAGITALLDWEFAHAGDPVEDLGYARQFIEPLGCWETFLDAYQAEGGVEYRHDSARFYEVWRSVRNAVCCMTAWHGFLDGSYPALKMAYQGIVFYPHFAHDAAVQLRKELP